MIIVQHLENGLRWAGSMVWKPIVLIRQVICFLYRRYEWIRRFDCFRTGIWGIKDTFIYNYPHRILFIVGMSKSGSSWVHAFLLNIPGFQRPPLVDRSGIKEGRQWDESYFTNIPQFGYYALKTHAQASSELLGIIQEMDLPTLVTYRDIRDQLVSRFHHILVDCNSLHYELYSNMPRDEAFSHSIEYALDLYTDWVEDWLTVVKKEPDRFLPIRYEDLLENTFESYKKILLFYGINFPDSQIRKMIVAANAWTRGGVDTLAERIKLGGGTNFRAGRKGDWRTHFSENDVKVVKQRTGDQLIRLGYEKNMNWCL